MAKLTDADSKTFISDILAALEGNKDALTAGNPEVPGSGWDPTSRITAIKDGQESVANDEQIISPLEVALAQAVKTRRTNLDVNYRLASATVSSVEGALGKDHPLTRDLRQLRGRYSNEPTKEPDPAAAPLPA